jgi:hypothetical protein
MIAAYAMAPLNLAALFTGALFLSQSATVIGFAMFVYLLFFGYRRHLKFTMMKSAFMTLLVAVLFALIRQMFVFVIGF